MILWETHHVTSALTNQRWVFKACLTQTEWVSDEDQPSGLYTKQCAK